MWRFLEKVSWDVVLSDTQSPMVAWVSEIWWAPHSLETFSRRQSPQRISYDPPHYDPLCPLQTCAESWLPRSLRQPATELGRPPTPQDFGSLCFAVTTHMGPSAESCRPALSVSLGGARNALKFNARNAIPSQNCSLNRKCSISSARESL